MLKNKHYNFLLCFEFQVPAQKLTKAAFWTQVDEERLASQSLVDNLMDKFGTKPIAKENQMNGGDEGSGGGTGTIGENEKQDGKFNLRQTKTGLTLLSLL